MKTKLLLLALLTTALSLGLSTVSVAATPDQAASVAKKKKKKLSYCQKAAKKNKATKLNAHVKKAKFFLYTSKRFRSYFFCSESPKFTGTIAEFQTTNFKASHVRAVRGKCAAFYSFNSETGKELKTISFRNFRRGAQRQTNASVLGRKIDKFDFHSLSLAPNCMLAAAYRLNDTPVIRVDTLPQLGFAAREQIIATGATDAELKKVKISNPTPLTALVTWTQGGVPQQLNYAPAIKQP